VKREMGKYSLVCTARPSFLCFLSLSFGEGKVMVGIVDPFDKKGYELEALYPWSSRLWWKADNSELIFSSLKQSWKIWRIWPNTRPVRAPGGWQDMGGLYWYSAMGLAYNAVTSRFPLILIVMSIKITFVDSFVDVHLRPIVLMRVLNRIQFAASTSGSGSWIQIPRPSLMNLFR
jgi:hypothetical protein